MTLGYFYLYCKISRNAHFLILVHFNGGLRFISKLKMNCDLLTLLQISHRTSSNEEIQAVTQALSSRMAHPGYVHELLPIIGNLEIDENTTCAALIQLKSCVRTHWNCKYFGRKEDKNDFAEDKKFLMDNLLMLNIGLSDNYKYGKIIKDIITCLGGDVLSLVSDIVELMRQGREIRTCMNFLLGIVGYYQFLSEKPSEDFFNCIRIVIPLLNDLVISQQGKLQDIETQHHTMEAAQEYGRESLYLQELLYLGIKLMKKCLNWMNNQPDLRQHSVSWAIISLSRVNVYNEAILNSTGDQHNLKFPRGSEPFFYFHERKWAIKYLIGFIQKILIYKQSDSSICQTTEQFYQAHWNSMVEVLHQMFRHRSPKKMKFFEFQLLDQVFKTKPLLMSEWFCYYIEEVLPTFVYFVKEDIRVALSDPVEYIVNESQNRFDDYNLRKKAADLWTHILVDTDHNFNQKDRIQRYRQGLKVLRKKLESTEGADRICGGYLLEKFVKSTTIRSAPNEIVSEMQQLCIKAIGEFLMEENFLFLVSGLGIAKQAESLLKPEIKQTVGKFVKVIFTNQEARQLEGYQLVKIKCLIGMFILPKEWFTSLSDPEIEAMLGVFIQSLIAYELEEILVTFKFFIHYVSFRIKKYGIHIIRELGNKLRKILCDKSGESAPKVYMLMNRVYLNTGMITTLTLLTFLITPENMDIQQALEDELLQLLYQLYSADPEKASDITQHNDDILDFWHQFLLEMRANNLSLSTRLWFFYSIIVFKMHGLPAKLKGSLEKRLQMNEVQMRILNNCFEREEYVIIPHLKLLIIYQQFLPIDSHLRPMKEVAFNIFAATSLERLFMMALNFYQNKKPQESEFQYIERNIKGQYFSTVVMTYLVEEHGPRLPAQAMIYVWLIIVKNHKLSFARKFLKRYNVQLMLMWIYSLGMDCFKVISEPEERSRVIRIIGSMIEEMMEDSKFNHLEDYFWFYQEFRRGVLGLSTILRLAVKVPFFRDLDEDIISILLTLVRKTLKILKFQIYSEDWDEYDEEEEEYNYEEWRMANNFDQCEDGTQTDELDGCNLNSSFAKEPNYVVEFPSFYEERANVHPFVDDLQELTCPENINEDNYVSRLEAVLEYEQALAALLFYKENCPQRYSNAMVGPCQCQLGSILQALNKDEQEFKKYKVTAMFKMKWSWDNEQTSMK